MFEIKIKLFEYYFNLIFLKIIFDRTLLTFKLNSELIKIFFFNKLED